MRGGVGWLAGTPATQKRSTLAVETSDHPLSFFMTDTSEIPITARREIARRFEELAIFARPRELALYHFCAVIDLTGANLANPDLLSYLGRQALEASNKAIPAIYRKCATAPDVPLRLNPAIYQEAHELLSYAYLYDQIAMCYEWAEREQFAVRFDTLSQQIVFDYASSQESSSDTLLRSRELVANRDETGTPSLLAEIGEISRAVAVTLQGSILSVSTDEITYPLSPALLAIARRWSNALVLARRWEFPETLAIGGTITFGDFRKFWSALITIVNIHDLAHRITRLPRGSLVNLRPRNEWAELIAEIGGISVTTASELLWWFTFDVATAGATPPIQPFFGVSGDRLCVPSIFVSVSNVERNLLKVMTRHPRLRAYYQPIKAAKEGIALGHLSQLLPAPKFAIAQRVVIAGVTDADLVVYERSSGFVLIIQHKWLIAPETRDESNANDDQLKEGASQALKARDAFRLNPDGLRAPLLLVNADNIGEIEAIVVCRGAESTGFLEKQPVPIILETAFEDLWTENDSLPKLWEKLNARPDHTEAASRYNDTFAVAKLAGYEFRVPTLGKEIVL
jgi:hypothetical protein